jgi:hypothetical protein
MVAQPAVHVCQPSSHKAAHTVIKLHSALRTFGCLLHKLDTITDMKRYTAVLETNCQLHALQEEQLVSHIVGCS